MLSMQLMSQLRDFLERQAGWLRLKRNKIIYVHHLLHYDSPRCDQKCGTVEYYKFWILFICKHLIHKTEPVIL